MSNVFEFPRKSSECRHQGAGGRQHEVVDFPEPRVAPRHQLSIEQWREILRDMPPLEADDLVVMNGIIQARGDEGRGPLYHLAISLLRSLRRDDLTADEWDRKMAWAMLAFGRLARIDELPTRGAR